MKKRELFEQLLKKRGINISSLQVINPGEDEGPYLLSFAQQRIWFLQQFEPTGAAYNNPSAVRINGPLDIPVLKKTFQEIIRRHKILQVYYEVTNGQPTQVVKERTELDFSVTTLEKNHHVPLESRIQERINSIGKQPFNLSRDPFIRISLLKINKHDNVLVINLHHIISDGWSKGILLKELAAIYQAFLEGSPSPLADLPIQYFDYVRWQHEQIRSEFLLEQLTYWKDKLKGSPPILELPYDYARPSVQSGKGTFEIFEISREKLSALKSLARQKKITLFILLLATLKTLLYRYTGQEDILIGTPIAGRNRREIENLIGLFVNTLVLRTDLSGNPDFNTLLIRVQETALEAYNYQDMPFEKLVEEINPARDMSHTPLYQVMFQLDNAPLPPLHFSGLQLIPLQIDSGMSQVDLSMTCWEEVGLLKGTLEYSTDLFHPSTINRMILHYKILLDDIIAHPDKKLRLLSILTPAEKRQILDEWNDTKAVYPFNDSIAHLFEIQVEKAPHAFAVIHKNDKITYEQLNSQANQLAHFLKKRKVGTETLVGLCLETSIALIIGVLGILKTGAAYVPLDPDYPRERLDWQLKDLQTSIVITKKYHLPKLPGPMMEPICLDSHWNRLEGESKENLPVGLLPHNLACVIYTSGSTGHPKGVLIENRNIINLITSFIRSYHVNAKDCIMPITSLASASFVGEVFPILTAGGSLVLADIKTYLNMGELVSFMDNYNVTILSTVPSMMARLNSYPQKPKKIRLFLCGGEPLFPFHIDKFREAVTFVNGYGLTEATICTTYKILNRQDISGEAYFSLGKPIMNNQVYILDKYLKVMPIGTTGEIHIAGEGIVRGFLNTPELTGEKLINNPYLAGKKMLKTGDLGSWLPNGEIKFSGRMDNQVQLHGFRIELKEIETHLGLHPGVQDTSVIVREDIPGDKRLVAYLTFGKGKQITSDELRDWLGKRIPSYMVPGIFIFLDSLPINPNGKVDIKSLPVPLDIRPHLVASYEQPQTETEKSVASIWRELLHLEEIGINDNFFDLGGHSLMITQVHSRLQDLYEKEITIVHLFKYTTIHSLANFISGDQTKQPAFDKIYGKIKKRKDVFNQYLQRGSKNRTNKVNRW